MPDGYRQGLGLFSFYDDGLFRNELDKYFDDDLLPLSDYIDDSGKRLNTYFDDDGIQL